MLIDCRNIGGGTISVYDGGVWHHGISKDQNKKEVNVTHSTARVVTVQQPTYAAEGSVESFLRALPYLNEATREKVWQEILHDKNRPSIDALMTVHCADESEAVTLVAILKRFMPKTTVKVASFTKHNVAYNVEVENRRPVSCSCPDFVNRSQVNPYHVCKHMSRVSTNPSVYGI